MSAFLSETSSMALAVATAAEVVIPLPECQGGLKCLNIFRFLMENKNSFPCVLFRQSVPEKLLRFREVPPELPAPLKHH